MGRRKGISEVIGDNQEQGETGNNTGVVV